MEEFIEVWTCSDGVHLLSKGLSFWAWNEDLADEQVLVKVQKEFAEVSITHGSYRVSPQGVVEVCGYAIG